jgi:hypothetical protein
MKSCRSLPLRIVGWMLGFGLVPVAPVLGQAINSRSVIVTPVQMTVPVPCALNGLGENVFLSGQIRSVIQVTEDARGVVHYTHHLFPDQVRGLGQTSGVAYKGVGMHYHSGEWLHGDPNDRVNNPLPSPPYHLHYIQNFWIIGQGPGNNFLLHINWHVTVNANGVVTAFVDGYREQCR